MNNTEVVDLVRKLDDARRQLMITRTSAWAFLLSFKEWYYEEGLFVRVENTMHYLEELLPKHDSFPPESQP